MSNAEKDLDAVNSAHQIQVNLMDSILSELLVSDEFNPIELEESPLKAMTIIERLKQFRTINKYYDNIVLYFNTDKYVYTCSTSMSAERFTKQAFVCEGLNIEEISEHFKKNKQPFLFSGENVNGYLGAAGQYLCYCFPIKKSTGGFLMFIVNQQQFSNLLKSDTNIIYGISDVTGKMHVSSRVQNLSSTFENGRFVCNDKNYLSFKKEKVFGNSNLLVFETDDLLRKMLRSDAIMCTILFAALLCVAVMVISVSNDKITTVIKRIGAMLGIQADSFDVLETQISEIGFVELSKHSTTIEQYQQKKKRNHYLRRLLLSEFDNLEEIIKEAQTVGLDFSGGYYTIMVVGHTNDKCDELTGYFEEKLMPSSWFIETGINNLLLVIMNGATIEELNDRVNQVEEGCRKISHNCIIAQSLIKSDAYELNKAYLEAQTAYDSRFINDCSQILKYEINSFQDNTIREIPVSYIDMLFFAVSNRNTEMLTKAIDDMLNYLKSSGMNMLNFRMFYSEIFKKLIQKSKKPGCKQNMSVYYYLLSLPQCLTVEDLSVLLRSICTEIMQKDESIDNEDVINSIVDEINRRYSDPSFSFGILAEEKGLSPASLTIRFTENIGMTPSDYLLMVRMMHAQSLLVETELPIKEIAVKIGYWDVVGFQKKFKNYTSLTPSQYRANHDNN